MKIEYTESAIKELEVFQERQKQLLEEYLRDNKYVHGDEILEITASDVKEASKYVYLFRPDLKRSFSFRMASMLYTVMGFFILLYGFADTLIEDFEFISARGFIYVLVGFVMIFLGYVLKEYAKVKEERQKLGYDEFKLRKFR